jgi:hypothetical protein
MFVTYKKFKELGVVRHVCNPSTQKQEDCELKASLAHIARSNLKKAKSKNQVYWNLEA